MAKETAAAETTPKKAGRKTRQQLERAQTAQQKAERKVGKLQTRLRQAESKLAKRLRNLDAIQSRVGASPATPAPAPRKPKKAKPHAAPASPKRGGKTKAAPDTTPEQRLASINMLGLSEGVVSGTTVTAPVAVTTIAPVLDPDEQPLAPLADAPHDGQPQSSQAKSVAAKNHRPRPDVLSAE